MKKQFMAIMIASATSFAGLAHAQTAGNSTIQMIGGRPQIITVTPGNRPPGPNYILHQTENSITTVNPAMPGVSTTTYVNPANMADSAQAGFSGVGSNTPVNDGPVGSNTVDNSAGEDIVDDTEAATSNSQGNLAVQVPDSSIKTPTQSNVVIPGNQSAIPVVKTIEKNGQPTKRNWQEYITPVNNSGRQNINVPVSR